MTAQQLFEELQRLLTADPTIGTREVVHCDDADRVRHAMDTVRVESDQVLLMNLGGDEEDDW